MSLCSTCNPTEGGQYCIDIMGCSSDSFGAIKPREKGLFKEMLDSQDVVASHPRKDVKAVAALKPYWEDQHGIFDWISFPPQPA